MSLQTIARRYSGALADVVISQGEAREVQEELLAWQSMIESQAELREVLSNPAVELAQKAKLLEALIARTRVRQSTANFLRVLLRNQRLGQLGEINTRFAQVLDERSGSVAAEVTTARPISQEMEQLLQKRLAELTGKEVRLSFATDEALLGGLVARIGSTVYDGSVRNQLQRVRERLTGRSG